MLVPLPLPDDDYRLMNCTMDEFSTLWRTFQKEKQYYIANTTRRLAEVEWISRRLESEVIRSRGQLPIAHEGLLSLQIYLLLTCADSLGHLLPVAGVGNRFSSFFNNLPRQDKENLLNDILVWRTDYNQLNTIGLIHPQGNIVRPKRSQLKQFLQSLGFEGRFEILVSFLYKRRNFYTHEAGYPQLGHHPNLAVMQRQRLNVPDTASVGEYDRHQDINEGDLFYFAYYETDDLIATIRRAIVRGLGQAIGRA